MTLRNCILVLAVLAPLTQARAQAVVYTDEGAFLAALTAQGFPAVYESFEDDAAWGDVRTTIPGGQHTAPSVHSQGLTWQANNTVSGITTGPGPARTGAYGYFQLPHGDWVSGIHDGFRAVGDSPLVAIGGWIKVNGTPGKIQLSLDGVPVDFGPDDAIVNAYQFFGAIDPAGFSLFEYYELEAMPDDWVIIFADDFTFAFGGTLIDCNGNGIADAFDISGGTSGDCNTNLIPDECEIAATSTAPGGPFYCTEGCDPDCNDNGILDQCETTTPVVYASGPLSPIGAGFPQSFLIVAPGPTRADAILDLRAAANFGGSDESIAVRINGASVGSVFVTGGSDCPATADLARIVVDKDLFNSLVGGGDALIELLPSAEVDPNDCTRPASWVEVDVTLFVPSSQDANGNGIPDECEFLNYCTALPNSSGAAAQISWSGSNSVSANDLELVAFPLPAFVNGLFIYSPDQAQIPLGNGNLCLGNTTQGFVNRLPFEASDGTGTMTHLLDLAAPPVPESMILPGSTWNFSCWFRDPFVPGAGFNFSDGLRVLFQP